MYLIMAELAGIKVKRSDAGVARFVTVDLLKHSDFIPYLEQKGIEVEQPVKWTAKTEEKSWLYHELEGAFADVRLMMDGKKRKKTLDELIYELRNSAD